MAQKISKQLLIHEDISIRLFFHIGMIVMLC